MATTLLTWDGTDENGQPLLWTDSLSWDGSLPQPNTTTMPNLRVLMNFSRGSDHAVEERATNVHTKLYVATVPYADPPVSAAVLQTQITDFGLAIAATEQGGTQATAYKNQMRANLIASLRTLAQYVQAHHNNDLNTLLLSGFDAVSTNRASAPLETPIIKSIVPAQSGRLKPRVTAVRNARAYDVRYALVGADGNPGPWIEVPNFRSTRDLIVSGLTPGAQYIFQVRAIGGSTRESDWSEFQSARCS